MGPLCAVAKPARKRFKKVYLEITNVCNKNCSFCIGTKRPPTFLSLEGFRHILPQIQPYTDYLYLHLMGEPLLHPDLKSMLALCAEHKLKVNLTTNGSLLTQCADVLLDSSALRKVSVSLHSFEEPGEAQRTYFHQCIRFAFDAAARGIICELRLWNLNSDAEAGNTEFIRIATESFGMALSPEMIQANQSGIRLADRIFLGMAERFEWPSMENHLLNQSLFCYGLRDQIGVLSDGRVVPCCLDHEGDITLGNLFETSLDEILQSPRAVSILEGFSRRKPVEPLCKRCGYARKIRSREG